MSREDYTKLSTNVRSTGQFFQGLFFNKTHVEDAEIWSWETRKDLLLFACFVLKTGNSVTPMTQWRYTWPPSKAAFQTWRICRERLEEGRRSSPTCGASCSGLCWAHLQPQKSMELILGLGFSRVVDHCLGRCLFRTLKTRLESQLSDNKLNRGSSWNTYFWYFRIPPSRRRVLNLTRR